MGSMSAAQFDRVATAYATSAVHAHGLDLQWLVEALEPHAGWQVADLGTGAGHAAFAVAPHVARVHAVDISEQMLSTASALARDRTIANISFYQSAVSILPFADASMDAVICRFSAHHWTNMPEALVDAGRILRPGGSLFLIDTVSPEEPRFDSFLNCLELLRDPSHARNLRTSEWLTQLGAAGFDPTVLREWQLLLEMDSWLARAATPDWRAAACRRLLAEADCEVAAHLAIAGDGGSFHIPVALMQARVPVQ